MIVLEYGELDETKTSCKTRESSCLNARGILSAAWQVLVLLLSSRGRVPNRVMAGDESLFLTRNSKFFSTI